MENSELLGVIDSMVWTKKAAIFLLLLDRALVNLESANLTHDRCEEAIDLCWQWMSDRSVDGDHLAYYLDSDEMQNGPLAEQNFESDSLQQNSLILILLVVGFFAHRAYEFSGQQEKMSASIAEANEGAIDYIVDYVDKTDLRSVLFGFLSKSETFSGGAFMIRAPWGDEQYWRGRETKDNKKGDRFIL
ncbi:Imm6 family immunity protein [Pseudomonas brassicacearum]|uniref:Imm6 family immunity protein n=1 Tax=Pseudomonas brassicacearum TaxID=930166 RepID=UPI001295B301|nr:Imm6 family immunity protein [Pseudomonas brassicacearum]QGA48295.1 hypothetical protein GFU70_03925 [Pseudomonas brassicacearum]